MRACAIALVLVACGAEADSRKPVRGISLPRGCRDRGCARGRTGSELPPYSFTVAAPSAACECAADPRLTVTSGATYCVKGDEWAGIQPGDFVSCAANRPRWMAGGHGDGGLGLQVWSSRTNPLTRSQDFSHADWTRQTSIIPAPTVTANACAAPDGTQTADMVFFPAAHFSSRISALYQTNCNIGRNVRTVYARTVQADAGPWLDDAGSLTGRFVMLAGNGGSFGSYCDHASTGYARCRQFDSSNTNIGQYFWLGVYSDLAESEDQYVCLWQADCQAINDNQQDPWPPPIATTAAGVTRAADVVKANAFYFPQWSTYLLQARVLDESGSKSGSGTLLDVNSNLGADGYTLRRSTDNTRAQCLFCSASACTLAESTATYSSERDVLQCRYDGNTTVFGCVNGSGCGDAGIDAGLGPQPYLTIGSHWNGFVDQLFADGVVKDISVSEAATKFIYLFGDSIVEGHTAGSGFEPQYLVHRYLIGNSVSIFNEAVSGEGSESCRARLLSRLNYVVDAGQQARTYFMLQCGINTIGDAGGTISDLQFASATAQDAGVHMTWSTVIPYLSQAAAVSSLNATMTAWANARGLTVANTFSAMEDPNNPGALNPAYDFGDTEHPNDAGVWVETNVWMNAGGWR